MNKLPIYLSVLLKYRRLIVINSIALPVLGVAISFVLPKQYTAVAQLLPPSTEDDPFGLAGSGILGGGVGSRLSRLARIGSALGEGTPSDVMVGIMGSRSIMDRVALRCSIARYYRIKPSKTEAIRKQLGDMTTFGVGDEGIVRVKVEAKTPQLAANVANAYVAELDSFLRTSNISRGRNMRMFLEQRLAAAKASLAEAQDSMRDFQSRHGVVSIEDETRAAIDAYARLKSQSVVKEAELGALQGIASADNPYVQSLRREADAFRGQLRGIERGQSGNGFGVGFAVSFERLPAIAAEYARRYLDLRVQEEAMLLLYQQYEYARVLEARDTPTLTVLDAAVPPQKKSSPKRTRIAGALFLFGLLSSGAYAFLGEYFLQLKQQKPEEYASWDPVRRQISAVAEVLLRPLRRSRRPS
uniref:Polysaccharide chain length determinant N-terminal domain-containing protein n=1 Tax=candidate division WOR-3 bacterium TaxID=2052148 RepID=A0A7C4CA66_UNCW3